MNFDRHTWNGASSPWTPVFDIPEWRTRTHLELPTSVLSAPAVASCQGTWCVRETCLALRPIARQWFCNTTDDLLQRFIWTSDNCIFIGYKEKTFKQHLNDAICRHKRLQSTFLRSAAFEMLHSAKRQAVKHRKNGLSLNPDITQSSSSRGTRSCPSSLMTSGTPIQLTNCVRSIDTLFVNRPSYLRDLLTVKEPSRGLRSQSVSASTQAAAYRTCSTAERAFSYFAATIWNI